MALAKPIIDLQYVDKDDACGDDLRTHANSIDEEKDAIVLESVLDLQSI